MTRSGSRNANSTAAAPSCGRNRRIPPLGLVTECTGSPVVILGTAVPTASAGAPAYRGSVRAATTGATRRAVETRRVRDAAVWLAWVDGLTAIRLALVSAGIALLVYLPTATYGASQVNDVPRHLGGRVVHRRARNLGRPRGGPCRRAVGEGSRWRASDPSHSRADPARRGLLPSPGKPRSDDRSRTYGTFPSGRRPCRPSWPRPWEWGRWLQHAGGWWLAVRPSVRHS